MPLNSKGRSPNLDIIRIFALLTVVGVHFFINTDFLEMPIDNIRMYILTTIRTFCAICVPLFIILSGYLMKNKKLSKKYYLGIVKTIGIYLLASFACYIYRVAINGENISVLSMGTGILNFTTAPYAWYVEMYIGLFLLIPFLNLIYNNLESKNHKLVLILTLVALTAAPGVLNAWNFASPSFFANPSASDHYINLIPDWWTEIYPITYYFIGCWLREYGLGISRIKNLLLLIASVVFWGLFNVYRSYPLPFVAGGWVGWSGLPQLINTTLVFNLLLNIKESTVPQKLYKPLNILSDLTFGAYLMSYASDQFIYAKLFGNTPSAELALGWFPVVVLASAALAFAMSFVLNVIYKLCYNAVTKIIVK